MIFDKKNGDGNGFNRLISRLFPERQLLLRTNGDVTFLKLSKRMQITLTAALLVLLLWMAFASIGIGVHRDWLAARDAQIEDISHAYDQLTNDMQAIQQRYETITLDLEGKHEFLSKVLAQRSGLENRLKKLTGELIFTTGERDQAKAVGYELRRKLTDLDVKLDRALGTADHLEGNLNLVSNRLLEIRSDRDEANREVALLGKQLAGLNNELAAVNEQNNSLNSKLASTDKHVTILQSERNALTKHNTVLDLKVTKLETRLHLLKATQATLVTRIYERTNDSIDGLEAAVRSTGLDLGKLLSRVGVEQYVGGPEIDFSDVTMIGGKLKTPLTKVSIASLEGRLDQWNALTQVLEIIPFSSPVDEYRVTSGYGIRRDPFTKRRAFHGGVDLAGGYRASILATAAGVVKYVGWRGPYGRTVEIDHGHGLRTRYGHLRKIVVKRGQRLGFRQKIGVMGSSGRSSGPHLHYEIRFDRKPLNPMQFIKAGKNVFKQG